MRLLMPPGATDRATDMIIRMKTAIMIQITGMAMAITLITTMAMGTIDGDDR